MKHGQYLIQIIILTVVWRKVHSEFDCQENEGISSGTCQKELFCIYQEAFEERVGYSRYCRCKTVISDLPLPDNVLTYSMFRKICWQDETKLQQLWIIDAELEFIDSEIFGHYPNLQSVNLSGNKLRLNFSEEAETITDLDISNNGLNLIQEDAFDNLKSLKTLNISFNGLDKLNFCLNKLNNLEEVYINNNYLTQISNELDHLQKLRVLNLAHNLLTAIESNIFFDFYNLQELYLNNNQLISITQYQFIKMPHLKILKISDNLFTKLGDYHSFKNLEELHCDNNQMQTLNKNFFGKLVKLKLLNMSNNQVPTLQSDTFPAKNNLQLVDLSSNKLTHVEASNFQNFQNLSLLNFNNNSLSQDVISCDNLQNLKHVNILHLSHNQISEIFNCTFSKLENLSKLTLLANQLEKIPPSAFSALTKLQELNLAENRIIEIPEGVFDNLVQLRKLDVSHNKLTKFDLTQLKNNAKVTELYVSHNQLQKLDMEVLKNNMPELKFLDFDVGLASCDDHGQVLSYFEEIRVMVKNCPFGEKYCVKYGFSGKMVGVIVAVVIASLLSVVGLFTILCKVCTFKEKNTIQLLPILNNPK